MKFIRLALAAFLVAISAAPAQAQMMHGNDFPFWIVDGALTVKAEGSESFLNLTASQIVATDANSALTTIATTGTGNMVQSASPTFTGTITAANETLSGTLGVTGVGTFTAAPVFSSASASQAMFTNGSKALVSNAITGTGNVVMSASPTLTGTVAAASETLSGTLAVTGVATFTVSPVITTSGTPASGDACTAGTITWGSAYIYVCTASGAWKRAALTGAY